jgi:heat shock protein HslJ
MVNRKIISLLGLLCIFSFVSSAENILNGKTYRVVEYTTNPLTRLSQKLNLSHRLKFFEKTMQMSGVCNSCNFNVHYMNNNRVKFTIGVCTLLGCPPDQEKLENDLLNVLQTASKIRQSDKYLYISNPGDPGEIIKLIEI